jgi:DHA1 family arabinose polymer transporter-like MFS transporter
MTKVSGFEESSITYIMILVGLGMVVGNLLGGVLADKISPIKSCILFFLIIATNLSLFFLFAQIPNLALLLCFLSGASFLALAAPIQLLMMRTAGKSEMVGSGVTQASFNIGNSLGAYLGGVILFMGFGFEYPALIGAFLALIGFSLAFTLYKIGNVEASKSSKKVATC